MIGGASLPTVAARVAVALAAVAEARVAVALVPRGGAVAVVAADPAVVLGADVGVAAPPPQAASKVTSPPPGRPRQQLPP